jgi:hypothetical protein
MAGAGERVTAPADEMCGVEGEIGPVGQSCRGVGQEGEGVVEGIQAGVLLPVGSECLAMRGGEPGAQQGWAAGTERAGSFAELGGIGGAADIGEHDGLLGEGMGKHGGTFGSACGIDGSAIVLPSQVNFSTVEGLPAREGMSIGEYCGQGTIVRSTNTVFQQLSDVIGVLTESTE